MPPPNSLDAAVADAASARLSAAATLLAEAGAGGRLVVAPSLAAGSRVLRLAEDRRGARGATFGWHRVTLRELALRLASSALASSGRVAVAPAVRHALLTRVVFGLHREGALGRFAPVGERPGLPRALGRTFEALGAAGIAPGDIEEPDLRRIGVAYQRALGEVGLADGAAVLEEARRRAEDPAPHPLLGLPTVVVDVRVRGRAEAALIEAVARRAPSARVTVVGGDRGTARRLGVEAEAAPPRAESSLERLQAHLFRPGPDAPRPNDGSVEMFSAPGESREAVEIARRVMAEARAGRPFDRIAVLTHAPERYRSVLVEAFRRAEIPAWFDRGVLRPDPGGRALLALLDCAATDLGARAFGEYLSLGVVPDAAPDGAPPSRSAPFVPPSPDGPAFLPGGLDEAPPDPEEGDEGDAVRPVVWGSLRAPWRWEKLVVDAAVVGGADRWRRRLDALEAELRAGREEDPEDPFADLRERRLADLLHLRAFALPLLERLEGLPEAAPWSRWLAALRELAAVALRHPARVLGVLADLAPLGPIGPVRLAEVRTVLRRRLTEVVTAPSGRPEGRVFVAPVEAARGHLFDVVFVPGLVERGFPRKLGEDPVLLDDERARLSADLPIAADRVADERLALRLAAGAARERVVFSYPRIDGERGRPRVPSFYALEVLRAAEGELLDLDALARRTDAAAQARLGWPAPPEPEAAIDAGEYDLAVLRLHLEGAQPRPGAARYLLESNPHLGRALRARWRQWHRKWTRVDGFIAPDAPARDALARRADGPFAATALEAYAACPYRFYLRAVARLTPPEVPEPLEAFDARRRGQLFHEAAAAVSRALMTAEETEAGIERAVERTFVALTEAWRERLAPAIEPVFLDGVARIRRDVEEALARDREDPRWRARYHELAFGLRAGDAERDPESTEAPVVLEPEGLRVRGSIDRVDVSADGLRLRVVDYKTARTPPPFGTRIAGGTVLQPLLYARALEGLRPELGVEGGRLYYATARGSFQSREIPLDEEGREGLRALGGLLRWAFDEGAFHADPKDGAETCRTCTYRGVCGPDAAKRARLKPTPPPLAELRRRR
jgi:ATP-dependent helicase/nuclease subunit B